MNTLNETNELDDALVSQIKTVLHNLPGWSSAQISLRILPGGITNRNFVADIDGSEFVIRIPGERTEVLGINREHEANASQRAADLAIAPGIAGELSGFNT